MSETLPTIDEIVDTFAFLTDWEDRYRFLIDLGEELPPLDPSQCTEANRVSGCVSSVWITVTKHPAQPSALALAGDSETGTVKGLVAILVSLYSGKTPRQILDVDADRVFARLGLYDHLSPTRHVGVYAMVEHIKQRASALLSAPGGESQTYPSQRGIATSVV